MPALSTLVLFSAAALALLVVPGPAVTYIVSQSLAHGRRAGLVSMLGIQTGGLLHVLAATAGLSALLVSSSEAFTAVRLVGAAYLVALGLRRLLKPSPEALRARENGRSHRRLFAHGVVVNVLNPKAALFLLAFLPQFVRPGHGPAALQIFVLGVVFLVLATLSDGTYALVAGTAARRFGRSERAQRGQERVAGAVLVGLGAAAALSGSRPT